MDTAKAIQLLHRLSDEQFDGQHGDERREALSMAVRALESNLVKESGDLVKDLVKDCISRKMAIEAFEPEHSTDWYTPNIIEVLETLPSVQLERKKGKWIITKTECAWNCGEYPIEVTCSNCGYIEDYYKKNNFCPCCGADMRGDSDEL